MSTPSKAADKAAPSAPTRLWSRDFFLLWQGQAVSQLGSNIHMVGLSLWIVAATGSATVMGTLMAASSLPCLLFGPIGGAFADRHDRKRIIVVCDVVFGMLALSSAACFVMWPERTQLLLGVVFAAFCLGSINVAFFGLAVGALLPDLVLPARVRMCRPQDDEPRGLLVRDVVGRHAAVYVGEDVPLAGVLDAPLDLALDLLGFLPVALDAMRSRYDRFIGLTRPRKNGTASCELLTRIALRARRIRKKILLVTDNARFHKTKKGEALIEALAPWVKIAWPPKYSSNLNVIEAFWKHMKRTCFGNRLYRSAEEFERHVDEVVERMCRDPEAVLGPAAEIRIAS